MTEDAAIEVEASGRGESEIELLALRLADELGEAVGHRRDGARVGLALREWVLGCHRVLR